MKSVEKINSRFRLLAAVFIIWALVAAGRAFYLAGPGRAKFIELGEAIARREPVLPASRGRILDRDGVPLAWNERYYDLYSDFGDDEPSRLERATLRRIFGVSHPEAEPDGLLRRNLSARELVALESPIRDGARLRIVPRVERITVSSSRVRRRIGRVEVRDGEQYGVSGFELEYDSRLRGRNGRARVLLDRWRGWIPSSWEIVEAPVPGQDVRLDYFASELERSPEE